MEDKPNNSLVRTERVGDTPQWLSIITQIPVTVLPLMHIRVMATSGGVAIVHHHAVQLILRAPTIRTGVQGAEPGHVQPVAVLHCRVDPDIYIPLQPPKKVTGIE